MRGISKPTDPPFSESNQVPGLYALPQQCEVGFTTAYMSLWPPKLLLPRSLA